MWLWDRDVTRVAGKIVAVHWRLEKFLVMRNVKPMRFHKIFKSSNGPSFVILVLVLPLLLLFFNRSVFALVTYDSIVVINNPDIQEAPVRFGMGAKILGDIDGDGVSDFGIGAPFHDSGPKLEDGTGIPLNVGRFYAYSGADLSLLITMDDPEFQQFAKFGRVADAGDVDRDGTPDILASAYFRNAGGLIGVGQAYVFSGRDNSILHTFDHPDPQALALFGCYVIGLGDVNNDGVPDQVVSAPFQHVGDQRTVGKVYVFSGADGNLLYSINDPTPQEDARFGLFLAGAGDLNGDSVLDLIVGSPGQSSVFVFSGADGSLLLTLGDPTHGIPPGVSKFGKKVSGGRDVNGDQIPDILVGSPFKTVDNNLSQGQAFVFSGADGTVLHVLSNPEPQPFTQFGGSVNMIADVDGDGTPDFLIGAPDHDVGGLFNVGRAFIFSGVDGSLLHTFDHPLPQAFANFGFRVRGADFDGDGIPDLVITAPLQDIDDTSLPVEGTITTEHVTSDFHVGQGVVFIFLSAQNTKTALSDGGDNRCFIATAVYGSPMYPQVQLLREFRDRFLQPYEWGEKLANAYYAYSPPFADRLREQPLLKAFIRMMLWPFIGVAWIMLKTSMALKLVIVIGIACIVCVGLWLKNWRSVGVYRA